MNNIMSKKILMVFAGLSIVLGLAASNTLNEDSGIRFSTGNYNGGGRYVF